MTECPNDTVQHWAWLRSGEQEHRVGPMSPFFIKHSHKVCLLKQPLRRVISHSFSRHISIYGSLHTSHSKAIYYQMVQECSKDLRRYNGHLSDISRDKAVILGVSKSLSIEGTASKVQASDLELENKLKNDRQGRRVSKVIQQREKRTSEPIRKPPNSQPSSPFLKKSHRKMSQTQKLRRLSTLDPKQFSFVMYMKHYQRELAFVCQNSGLRLARTEQYSKPPKYWVGPGNNSLLIASAMNKRWWWSSCQHFQKGLQFYWTQLKIPQVHRQQPKAQSTTLSLPVQRYGLNQDISESQIDSKSKKTSLKRIRSRPNMAIVHNHLPQNYVLGNKKALLLTLKSHYSMLGKNQPDYIPTTFHVAEGLQDPEYSKFIRAYYTMARRGQKGLWILKPGELTNRGSGITVHDRPDTIKSVLRSKDRHGDGQMVTYIIQKYIDRPLLYRGRKFDIRHYMLATCLGGTIKGYWYQEGYIRTACREFSLQTSDPFVHLTNDAVQKNCDGYGKYEKANKLSYQEFDAYLSALRPDTLFTRDIVPQLREIAAQSVKAACQGLDPQRREHNFQLFGLDFMIDQDLKPYLIQINSNPCLELCCPLLGRLLPEMIDHLLRITLDPLFPPPALWPSTRKHLREWKDNRFVLFFDQKCEVTGPAAALSGIRDQDQLFEDNGTFIQL